MAEKETRVEIVDNKTGEVVETIDTTGMHERRIDRMVRRMLTNMDRNRFHVREVN